MSTSEPAPSSSPVPSDATPYPPVADVVTGHSGKPGDVGIPGRYCPPAVCYCGDCSWWKPRPVSTRTASAKQPTRSSWNDREGATWIDKL